MQARLALDPRPSLRPPTFRPAPPRDLPRLLREAVWQRKFAFRPTPHETRLAILEDDQLAEIYYERENEYTLAGSIYKGRVTRVLPGMQSAFVDVGLERDAFLYVTDFLEEQDDSEEYEGAPASREPRVRSAGEPGTEPAAEPRDEGRSRPDRSGERGWRGTRRPRSA